MIKSVKFYIDFPSPCSLPDGCGSHLAPVAFQRPHGRASTDKLLKNHGCCGSRHNGGHKPLSPLILLTFFDQNIHLRDGLAAYSVILPVRPYFVVTVARGNMFHALGTCIGAPEPHDFGPP